MKRDYPSESGSRTKRAVRSGNGGAIESMLWIGKTTDVACAQLAAPGGTFLLTHLTKSTYLSQMLTGLMSPAVASRQDYLPVRAYSMPLVYLVFLVLNGALKF